jgi:hypothetical protein
MLRLRHFFSGLGKKWPNPALQVFPDACVAAATARHPRALWPAVASLER